MPTPTRSRPPENARRDGPAVRAAVIGLGSVSFEHLERIQAMPGVALVGVCDLSDLLVASVAERFGTDGAFTDHRRMLEQVRPDVVHVLTPPQAHRALAQDALESGAHVFVEKPAATTWEDYTAIRDAAARHGRLVCENYNYRYTDVVLQAIELHRSGALGRTVHAEATFGGVMGSSGPYGDRDVVHFAHALPGGALQNFVTHPVSLVTPFLGACTGVSAWRRRLDPDALGEDELRGLLAGPEACGTVVVTSNTRPPMFTLRVRYEGVGRGRHLQPPARGAGRPLGDGGADGQGLGARGLVGAARRSDADRPAQHLPGLGTLVEAFYAAVRGTPAAALRRRHGHGQRDRDATVRRGGAAVKAFVTGATASSAATSSASS
jgi:predicted dehydrogenase